MCPANRKSKSVGAYLEEYKRKRDFTKTREPSGGSSVNGKRGKELAFVIQKHAASHLHFDLRLEVGGVMKSWAVPKGPSVDTSVKRLAMEVEDHPIAYNSFEGTIPKGEYGGGTVMLWDRGTYTVDEVRDGESEETAAERALKSGKLAFTFRGQRLRGSFALVRTRRGEERAQWLLIKHDDKFAKAGRDIFAEVMTSVESDRTMEEIAAGDNEALGDLEKSASIEPMLATKSKSPIPAGEYAIERRVQGTRAIAFLANGTAQLMEMSRKHNQKPKHLLENAPEVEKALLKLSRNADRSLILDGVLVDDGPSFVVFDLLLDGQQLILEEPWIERREKLEEALSKLVAKPSATGVQRKSDALQMSDWVASDSEEILVAIKEMGAARVIAKRIDSPYESGLSKYWREIST